MLDIKIFLLLWATVNPTFATWTLELEPDFEFIPCMPDGKWHLFDFSNLTAISNYKTYEIYLNGSTKTLMPIEGVIELKLTSQRNHKGKWEDGDFQWSTDNWCTAIANPFGQPILYHVVQRALRQKRCPYKKGYTQTYNMFSISPVPMIFPSEYMDEWRGWAKFYKDGKMIDCIYAEGEIID